MKHEDILNAMLNVNSKTKEQYKITDSETDSVFFADTKTIDLLIENKVIELDSEDGYNFFIKGTTKYVEQIYAY